MLGVGSLTQAGCLHVSLVDDGRAEGVCSVVSLQHISRMIACCVCRAHVVMSVRFQCVAALFDVVVGAVVMDMITSSVSHHMFEWISVACDCVQFDFFTHSEIQGIVSSPGTKI